MTHPDTLQIPRAVVEQAIDALALYASTYNLYWIRGMPILEPSAEAVLEQLRAALQPQAAAEPVEWKHDCSALCVNNLRLWVDRCPHCGKPRTETTPPATQAAPVNEWKEAIIEQLAAHSMDAPISDSPTVILAKIIHTAVLMATDPAINKRPAAQPASAEDMKVYKGIADGYHASLNKDATQAALTAALEALKNSVDTVWEEYTEAEHKYAAYDSRRAKLDGMKAMAQAHTDAITQIEALRVKHGN